MATHSRIDVLDIGARYGIHPTLEPLARVANVHCFEPDPAEAARLTAQYHDYPLVQIHALALGRRSQSRTFELRRHPGLSGFADVTSDAAQWQIPIRGTERTGIMDVTVRPLSDFISDTPTIIKIDTEGSEMEILESASSGLDAVIGLRVEVNTRAVWSSRVTLSTLDDYLTNHGFEFLGLDFPKNGSAFGCHPLETSRGLPIAGDALWVRRFPSGSGSAAEIVCSGLFLYANQADGLGLEQVQRSSAEIRTQVCSGADGTPESLLYAFVLRHLLAVRIVPYYPIASAESLHVELFEREIPRREEIFDRLRTAGLPII